MTSCHAILVFRDDDATYWGRAGVTWELDGPGTGPSRRAMIEKLAQLVFETARDLPDAHRLGMLNDDLYGLPPLEVICDAAGVSIPLRKVAA